MRSIFIWISNCFCFTWHGLQYRLGHGWFWGVHCGWKNLILIEKQSQNSNWTHWSGLKRPFFECIRDILLSPKRAQQTFEHFSKSKSAPSKCHPYDHAQKYNIRNFFTDAIVSAIVALVDCANAWTSMNFIWILADDPREVLRELTNTLK